MPGNYYFGDNMPFGGPPDAPQAPYIGPGGGVGMPPSDEEYVRPATPLPFDYWGRLRGFMGEDIEDPLFEQMRGMFTGNKNWRAPKQAEEIFQLADFLKAMGEEDAAMSLIMQTVPMGYRQPRFNVASLFGPQFQKWGLQYSQPSRSSGSRSSGGGQDLSALMAMLGG